MGLGKARVNRIKKSLVKKPFVFYFVFAFIFYIGLNVLVNRLDLTLPDLLRSGNWLFLIPYVSFNFLIVPFLIGLTVNLSIMRFKELGFSKKGSGSFLGSLGVLGGILSGACPACIAGLLPAILGIFGVAGFSLSALPLMGLEIQVLSSGLLVWAILLLSKDPTCKIKN